MKVFPIVYSGKVADDEGVVAVCASQERAIERAEGLAQAALDEEPQLSIDGWYVDTIETDHLTIVVLVEPEYGTVEEVWSITEHEVEE